MPKVSVTISAARQVTLDHPVHITNELMHKLKEKRVPVFGGLCLYPMFEGGKLTTELDELGDLVATYEGPLIEEPKKPAKVVAEDDDEL